jgi:hypothetical protein
MATGCFYEIKFCKHHKLLNRGMVSLLLKAIQHTAWPSVSAVPSIRLWRQSRTGMTAMLHIPRAPQGIVKGASKPFGCARCIHAHLPRRKPW